VGRGRRKGGVAQSVRRMVLNGIDAGDAGAILVGTMTTRMPNAMKIHDAACHSALHDSRAHREDFAGTLKEVRDAGYGAVEFAGHGGLGARELRQLLSDLGLEAAGSHVGIDALGADFGKTADFHEEIGCRNLVVPGPPSGFERTAAGWDRLGRRLGEAAPRCAARGLKLAYHNHDFEFQPFDGRTGHELLFAAAGAAVGAQVDTYWCSSLGATRRRFIRRMRGQVHSLH